MSYSSINDVLPVSANFVNDETHCIRYLLIPFRYCGLLLVVLGLLLLALIILILGIAQQWTLILAVTLQFTQGKLNVGTILFSLILFSYSIIRL
jgi:hypothetical protein